MGRLRGAHSAATIMAAATGAADGEFVPVPERAVTLVRGFANAACVRGRSSRHRRERKEGSDKREHQQKSGGQAVHAFCRARTPSEASIKQSCEWAQAEAGEGARPTQTRPSIQALPLILAHHQRTPTKRKRQSLRNSGGLPSKAWPTNWRIHPITNSASA